MTLSASTGSLPGLPWDDALWRRRIELILTRAVALFRGGAIVLLGVAVLDLGTEQPRRLAALGVVAAAVVVESVLFVVDCLRRGTVPVGWAAIDGCTIAAALLLSSLAWGVPGRAGESPYYTFVVMACVVPGVARIPAWGAVVAGVGLAAANAATAVIPGSRYPLWHASVDGLALTVDVLLTWVLAELLRRAAAANDRQRAKAVREAEVASRQQEQLRQGSAIRSRLLSTLEDVARAGAVTDTMLVDQLHAELAWLHTLAHEGPQTAAGLLVGLAALAEEKAQRGLEVRLDCPDREPVLTVPEREALLGAVREALTNTQKHAGVPAATVQVTVDPGVRVEVSDSGTGYDPARTVARAGQSSSIRRRLADVGGSVEIVAAPGAGTRVVLLLPARAPRP